MEKDKENLRDPLLGGNYVWIHPFPGDRGWHTVPGTGACSNWCQLVRSVDSTDRGIPLNQVLFLTLYLDARLCLFIFVFAVSLNKDLLVLSKASSSSSSCPTQAGTAKEGFPRFGSCSDPPLCSYAHTRTPEELAHRHRTCTNIHENAIFFNVND